MKFAVVVNDLDTQNPTMSTVGITSHLLRRGHSARMVPISALTLVDDQVYAAGEALTNVDLVVVRISPGRDRRPWAPEVALQLLAHESRRGLPVVNDPDVLRRCASKLFVHELDSTIRPRGCITRDLDHGRRFLADVGGVAVVKPLTGTGGFGVQRVCSEIELERALRDTEGMLIIQEFLDDAAQGDVRVLVWRGDPIQVRGRYAAVRRRPPSGDFRSNVSLGGTAEAVELDTALLAVVATARPTLQSFGLDLVGLDIVGGRVVEVNVFSPGGFEDASRFQGVDFLDVFCVHLEDAAEEGSG